MSSSPSTETGHDPVAVPSMLDLVRLSPRLFFPPGGVDLYRQIALLTDLQEGQEVLDVACGKGVALEYFVREYGVVGSGVDEDPRLIAEAEERAREAELSNRLQFQTAPADVLPYRDEIFDMVLGEIGIAAHADPEVVLREMVRVTKPGGHVVLIQLVWKAPVDEDRKALLVEHLGARPLMLVEWKRLLRAAGVEDVHTEDWSDDETAFRAKGVKPFPDFAEMFTLVEKVGILRRAWRRWGWSGVRTVLSREREIHRLLSRERILGLDLLKGRKPETDSAAASGAAEVETKEPAAAESATSAGTAVANPETGDPAAADPETAGLPLFGGGEEEEK
ncbi:MAG: class I SAM-dependent methyltransferase [Gemmatimonadota bacterium]